MERPVPFLPKRHADVIGRERGSWRSGRGPLWRHLIIAIAAIAGVTVVTRWLRAHVPGSELLFIYIPVVATLAYTGGLALGIVAGLLSILSAWYFVLPSAYSFALSGDRVPTLVLYATALSATVLGFAYARDLEAKRRPGDHAEHHLAAIVESSDDAILSKSLDGIVHTWNAAAERLYGYTPQEVVGRPVSMLAPPEQADEFPAIMARLKRGEVIAHYETVRMKKDGTRFDALLSISPIKDASGRIVGASAVGRDISERKRVQQELQAQRQAAERAAEVTQRLQRITAALSEARTPAQVTAVVLQTALQSLGANAAAIYMVPEDHTELELQDAVPLEHIDPARKRFPMAEAIPLVEVVKTGTSLFLENVEVVSRQSPQLSMFKAPTAGGRAYLPLVAGHRGIGVLELQFPKDHRLDVAQRSFLGALAGQCAVALERAHLYGKTLKVADTLQRAFLPADLPTVPGIAVSAAYLPATADMQVGGDWYDTFLLPDGRLALSVGDVVGHGLAAAATMGQLRQALRIAAQDTHSPAAALAVADQALRWSETESRMATALFGILDPVTLEFVYASAGHPTPVFATAGRAESLPTGGVPLGVSIGGLSPLQEHRITLPAGSVLALYTDGLVEGERDMAGGTAALLSAMQRESLNVSDDPARSILGAVLGGREPRDDVALLTVRVDAILDRLDVTLPARPPTLRLVRQAFQRTATRLGLGEKQYALLQVALGELVTNVIEHAYGLEPGPVTVRIEPADESVTIEVEDQGRWRAPRTESRGRGLRIVRSIAQSLNVEKTATGTRVRLMAPRDARETRPPDEDAGRASDADVPVPLGRERQGQSRQARSSHVGQFAVHRGAGIPVVDVAGVVDKTTVPLLEATLQDASGADEGGVIVVLDRASYVDSSGLKVLFQCHDRLVIHRQDLRLVISSTHPLRPVLHTAGLTTVVSVYETVEEASSEPTTRVAPLGS